MSTLVFDFETLIFFLIRSHFNNWKKLSATALSCYEQCTVQVATHTAFKIMRLDKYQLFMTCILATLVWEDKFHDLSQNCLISSESLYRFLAVLLMGSLTLHNSHCDEYSSWIQTSNGPDILVVLNKGISHLHLNVQQLQPYYDLFN